MLSELRNAALCLRNDEEGVTLVEYGIALVLAVSVGAILLTQLGVGINEQLTDSCAAMGAGVAAC